jgi:hypothetical protein
MIKHILLFFIITNVFIACTKKYSPMQLSDLGISIQIPKGFESVLPEELKQLQEESTSYPSILPFIDFPCYLFRNPITHATLVISKLTFIEQNVALSDPIIQYHKNLETYYGVDNIAINDIVESSYRLVIMNLLFTPEEGDDILLAKGIYHLEPDQFCMIDLYFNHAQETRFENENYEEMFLSIHRL